MTKASVTKKAIEMTTASVGICGARKTSCPCACARVPRGGPAGMTIVFPPRSIVMRGGAGVGTSVTTCTCDVRASARCAASCARAAAAAALVAACSTARSTARSTWLCCAADDCCATADASRDAAPASSPVTTTTSPLTVHLRPTGPGAPRPRRPAPTRRRAPRAASS